MKKTAIMIVMALAVAMLATNAALAAVGPAPNAGDGVPDGSGMTPGPVQNGDPAVPAPGPAPNAGDCVPDGSGF